MNLSETLRELARDDNPFEADLIRVNGRIGTRRGTILAWNPMEGSVMFMAGQNFVAIMRAPPLMVGALLTRILDVLDAYGHPLRAVFHTRWGLLAGPPSLPDLLEEIAAHLPD